MTFRELSAQLVIERANPIGLEIHGLPRCGNWGRGNAFEGEGSVARDHKAIADARKIGGEVLCDAISEIILAWIAREVPERQHHDGEMRSWCIRGDRHRSVHAE